MSIKSEDKKNIKAPRPEELLHSKFYMAANGSICAQCGSEDRIISVQRISGADAVCVVALFRDNSFEFYRQIWNKECLTHEDMVNAIGYIHNTLLK